jgi:hypothetical protein
MIDAVRPRKSRAALMIASAVVLLAAGPPQSPKEESPRARFEPSSAPGAGQALLARFAGDFDVVKTFIPREGKPVVAKGRCHQEMVRGGRFLRSDFTFGEGQAETTGEGLIGFEPETGAFTSVWTDSRQTRMSLRRSKDPFDGKMIVLYSVSLDGEAKDARRSKTVSILKDEGRLIIHQQFALGADGSERLMMSLEMTRSP